MKPRNDDFDLRRAHLKDMDDDALKAYFFELTDRLLDPIMEMAKTHTTPAIERSVLMRMGFSSAEAKVITDHILDHGLLSHGAGHIVYRLSKDSGTPIRETGLSITSEAMTSRMKEVFSHDTE
jgi:D-ornithine 4,5-aminomutase subunit alpha